MKDVLPIRANEETQARFRDFAAAGDFGTQTDFLNHLLTLYAAQETGIRVPTLEGAISAVNELADRINKVLIGAGETIGANQEKERARIEALRLEADAAAARLGMENEGLATALEEQKRLTGQAEEELAETREREKKLDQSLEDKAALIAGYREKIESLETEISRQKEIMTAAGEAIAELDALRLKTKEQALQIEHATLEKEIETERIKNLNEKALISLETKLRKEMNDRQAEYGKSINGYESKVYALLQELETVKKPKARE